MSVHSSFTDISRENRQRLGGQRKSKRKSLSWIKLNEEGVFTAIVEQSEKQLLKDLEDGVRSRDSLRFKQPHSTEMEGFYDERDKKDEVFMSQQTRLATSELVLKDPLDCRSVPGEEDYETIFKSVVCKEEEKQIGSIQLRSPESLSGSTSVSKKLSDTAHEPSKKSHADSSKVSAKQFCLGCRKPENEINFMGGLGPCVGNKRSDKHPQRPTAVQKIYRMRTGNYPLMSLTENPRTTFCPVPRAELEEFPSPKKIAEKVVIADNVDSATPSATSIVECEVFDFENPMNLDLQGQDYRQTYEKDEQEIENAREYYHQLLHMKRKVMKAEIAKLSEEKERKAKYSVPAFFDVDADFDDLVEEEEQTEKDLELQKEETAEPALPVYKKVKAQEISIHDEQEILAELYRTTTKKENQSVIENELNRRTERYYQLWVQRKNKDQKANEKKEEEEKIKAENLIMDLGEQFFEELLKDKYQECLDLYEKLPPTHIKRQYPHTLRETKHMKRKMAESRKVIRDKALIKARIFQEKGLLKDIPEIPPEPTEQTNEVKVATSSLSEQSTDDEDNYYVGKVAGEAYQLRGFHYKLDSEPRGLIDKKHKSKSDRPPRTCQTRSSWFRQLVPDISPPAFFQYNPSSIQRHYLPNDPDINLFPPEHRTVNEVHQAPIKEHLMNSSPDSYIKRKECRRKIKKPKYIKVKKFTLTGYMYGAKKLKKIKEKTRKSSELGREVVFEKFFQQIQNYGDNKRMERRLKRYQRLRYLGISYNQGQINEQQDSCKSSDTESSEWIPNDDENKPEQKGPKENISKDNLGRSSYDVTKHHTTVANMPAPKFREPTLKNHPRRPRIDDDSPPVSDGYSVDSVSIASRLHGGSETHPRSLNSTRAPYNVPRLAPIPPDPIRPANLELKKTTYTKLFDARHHHGHADPTDHKVIQVRYKNKVPNLKTPEKIATEKVSKQKRPFEKAYPRGKNFKEVDLSVPQVVYEEDMKDIKKNKSLRKLTLAKQASRTQVTYETKEKDYKSRESYRDDLPGKSEYIEAVRKMAVELRRELENIKECGNKLAVNEEEYAQEILKDIESIDSCVTSLGSSTCTNFTNDSGSFLMIQDKKIPCDYINKSFVPFEEIDRVRVKASTADAIDEYNAPYYTVPFAGQKQDQINLSKPKDKFYTYHQRSRVGMRQRLEVKAPDFKREVLGTDKLKAPSRLATEWDENFQHEIRNRPPVVPFKRKTTMMMLREGVRKKFETLYIREQITEQQIVQQREEEYANEIVKLRDMCQDLFQKWQERYYHTSMLMIEKIKPFYQKTDQLKKRYSALEKQMIKLNMRIVFIEDDWIRRTILQNFHYLIMEQNWRLKHDWIHLLEDGTLENFRTSINNRRTVNIRKRDRDDAWAIKEYYENVYLASQHPIEIVFPDAETFNDGVNKLKVRTFICLLEMHFSMWVLANLQNEYNQFVRDSKRFIEQTTKIVKNRGANRYFMEDRAKKLEEETRALINEPLYKSIASPRLRTIEPYCDMLYTEIIPQNIRNDVKEDCSALDKLQMIFGSVIDVIGKLDGIPTKKRQKIEKAYRKTLDYNKAQSLQACLIEKRIQLALEEVKRNMAPPYKKPPRTGKLPRVFFKKKKIVKKEVVRPISEKNMLFIQAFTESDAEEEGIEAADSDILNSLQDNCIPFYFDHFLRLHDYEPNYDFKTQIEINEGPEEKRLLYKDVLDNVMKSLEAWQAAKKKKMEADIQKTLYLYTDD